MLFIFIRFKPSDVASSVVYTIADFQWPVLLYACLILFGVEDFDGSYGTVMLRSDISVCSVRVGCFGAAKLRSEVGG